MDRVRNEEVRRRAGIEMELASRADQRVLRWFGHVERMDDYRMSRRVLMAEVSGIRVRGKRLGWMDGVKVALGMTVEAAGQCAKDMKKWRALVHMSLNKFRAAIFAWSCVLSDRPPMRWWLSHGEGRDAVGINCKKGATTENQGSAVSIWAKGCVLMTVCMFYLT